MSDDTRRDALTRRKILLLAGGGVAAVAGVESLAGCGETAPTGNTSLAAENVEAPQLRASPYIPSQSPVLCSLLSFFDRDEALAVEAFTARLLPGDESDPGARELCVAHYIDRKLAQHASFATPTYFKAPFAKPAVDHAPGRYGDTIYVDEEDLPLYGFQASSTPQEVYRTGLDALARASIALYARPFMELSEPSQDEIIAGLEATDPRAKPGDFPRAAVAKGEQLKPFFAPPAPNPFAFFSLLQDDTSEGAFADPLYGGNRDYGGWTLIGYPGAQRSYTADELKNGPRKRTIQGLRDMPPMHPGHPQPHAILPLAGSTREDG
jgi:gluconate 2-dehydrogenase gamma chain